MLTSSMQLACLVVLSGISGCRGTGAEATAPNGGLTSLKHIPRAEHPFATDSAWSALGEGHVRSAVRIPGEVAQRYGLRYIDEPGESHRLVLKAEDPSGSDRGPAYIGLGIYPSVSEARGMLRSRIFGDEGMPPLKAPYAVMDQAFAEYQENLGGLRVHFVTDNVVGEVTGKATDRVVAVAQEVARLIKGAPFAEERTFFLITREDLLEAGKHPPQCDKPPRPRDYLEYQKQEPLVEILSPENGSWAPTHTKVLVVRGRATDPRIGRVMVNGEIVPVLNGQFERQIAVYSSPMRIDVEIPPDIDVLRGMGATDRILVCLQGR